MKKIFLLLTLTISIISTNTYSMEIFNYIAQAIKQDLKQSNSPDKALSVLGNLINETQKTKETSNKKYDPKKAYYYTKK